MKQVVDLGLVEFDAGALVRSHVDLLDAVAVTVIALSAAVVLVVLVVSYLRPATTDGRVPAAVAALTGVIAAAQLATIVFTGDATLGRGVRP